MRFLFNPALLDFLVIIAVLNLVMNLLYLFGLVEFDYLARASQVTAIAFLVALTYTAIRERPARR